MCIYSSTGLTTSGTNILFSFHHFENSRKKVHTLIGLTLCFYNSVETELAQAVDVMIMQTKKISILMTKVDKLFPFSTNQGI